MSNPLHDRSRIVADKKCERAAFFGYELNGRGLSTGTAAYELYFGILIHDALATIARFHEAGDEVPIHDICGAGHNQLHTALMEQTGLSDYAAEQAHLLYGMIYGFYRYRWPILMESYPEIIAIEQEIVYEHDGCRFMAKPDLLVATGEGHITYIEFKSTSWVNDKWLESWETSPQLHSCMKAISATLGVDVTAAIVVGLYKGGKYKDQNTSPLCHAYHRPGNPPFQEEATSYTYKAGLKRYGLWELGISVPEWIDGMPEDLLAEQFPTVPPVYYRPYIADSFLRQAALRRKEIEIAKSFLSADPSMEQEILDVSFPQSFDVCKPSFGSMCSFYSLCHERGDRNGTLPTADEAAALRFRPREPHHTTEAEELA